MFDVSEGKKSTSARDGIFYENCYIYFGKELPGIVARENAGADFADRGSECVFLLARDGVLPSVQTSLR